MDASAENNSWGLWERWHYFVGVIKSRRWTLITFMTVTFLIVLVGTALQSRVYQATATVLIDMESPKVLSVSTVRDDSTVGQSHYLTYADYYRTQLEIIQTRHLAKQVFERLEPKDRDAYRKKKDPYGEMLKQVVVEPVKQTRLAKIHVEDKDPRQAARIANEFAYVFVNENLSKTARGETVTLMKNEYLKLQAKETELSKRYKSKFPSMVRIRQQIEQLEQAIGEHLRAEQYLEDLTDPESEKTDTPGEPEPEKMSDASDFESLFQQFQEKSLLGGLRPNNIRIQDYAQAPLKPVKPKIKINLLLGLLFGLLGGLAAVVIEEIFDNTVKTPADIELEQGIEFLGYVPRLYPQNGVSSPTYEEEKGSHTSENLFLSQEAAEAYRTIRTNLIFVAPRDARAVVVTSPGSGEGKTTTAVNLAIALAQVGLKILLVDADLRRPRIHEALETDQGPGLSDFLAGGASFDGVVKASKVSGLFITPSGICPPNPAELLGSAKMDTFIKTALQKFDRVLIDSPPVLPVTDSVILSAMAGAILIVAHCGKTPRQALRRLVEVCKEIQARILGVVLNNVVNHHVPAYGYDENSYRRYYSNASVLVPTPKRKAFLNKMNQIFSKIGAGSNGNFP